MAPKYKASYFEDRDKFSEHEAKEFGNSTYIERYSIGIGLWIAIYFDTHGFGDCLFVLETAYKSGYHQFGLENGTNLRGDNYKPIQYAAYRYLDSEECHIKKSDSNGRANYVNYVVSNWKKDLVAWLAFNNVEAVTRGWYRDKLNKWIYNRMEKPGCPLSVDTPDLVKYYENRRKLERTLWELEQKKLGKEV